jgi:hypothetical protein
MKMTTATEQEEPEAMGQGASTARELLDTAFSRLKDLGAGDEAAHLFPNGIESFDLEVGLDDEKKPGLQLALKITGASTAQSDTASFVSASSRDQEDDEAGITFDASGHRIIALIAMRDLETRAPGSAAHVQQILDEGDRSVKEAAVFPDVIRNQQPETKPFHFIDIPLKDGGPINPPLPDPPHVLVKIDDFTNFLRSGQGDAQEKVDALSWLFHLFGDVHQPLHCIERINNLHPKGDRGGNAFLLKGASKNLHSAWDGSVNIFQPGKDEDELAGELMQLHTRASLANDLQVAEPEKWARASFSLAKKNAYSLVEDPVNPPKPSQTYLKNMEKIGQKQAALAGYRLSDHLQSLFP